ncbi:hypothetical protein PC113_g6175 [Phytophthora cactorum]|nr:hypothetical protein PC113_g6175 [Phytophthora cactorum]KAG2933804.1 hypothetical protein PC115_g5350 [Phytophthora cactorum]KAG3079126.1 hypothetical protein PC121_g7065 [Phytophthora cactorum]
MWAEILVTGCSTTATQLQWGVRPSSLKGDGCTGCRADRAKLSADVKAAGGTDIGSR